MSAENKKAKVLVTNKEVGKSPVSAADDSRKRKVVKKRRKKKTSASSRLPVTHIDSSKLVSTALQEHTQGSKRKRKKKHAVVIAYVHKQLQNIEKAKAKGREEEASKLESKLNELGGLAAYQHFSIKSEGKFNTSRLVLSFLRKHNILPSPSSGNPLQMLDVGALAENYASHKDVLNVTAIDIHSNTPFVKQIDFFDFPLPASHQDEVLAEKKKDNDSNSELDEAIESYPFDVVCLCLVVNFVGDASRRGSMLFKVTQHLKPDGHLVLILPLACTSNSRYYNATMLEDLCQALGYDIVEHTESSRLGSWLLRLRKPIQNKRQVPQLLKPFVLNEGNKKVIRKGGSRNNFYISIDPKLCMSMLS